MLFTGATAGSFLRRGSAYPSSIILLNWVIALVFSSLSFLYLFLPVCLLLYFIIPKIAYKNAVLLVMSLLFYAWGEPKWIIVMLLMAFVDYFAG